MRVSKHLLHGKDNAITGTKLVEFIGLKELRDLTQLIESERRSGSPICASTSAGNHGYYLAADAVELEAYINSLDRRINNVSTTRKHLETTLLHMTGQGQIGGF